MPSTPPSTPASAPSSQTSARDAPLLDPVDRPMRRLFTYLHPLRWRMRSAIAWAATNKVFDLAPPLLVAALIDAATGDAPGLLTVTAGTDEPRALVIWLAVAAFVIFGGESLAQWRSNLGFRRLAQDMQHTLRIDAYRRMQEREIQFFEEHRLGKTMAMLNDDVNQLERFLNASFGEIVKLVVLIVFAGSVLFVTSWELALVGLAPVPIILWGSFGFSRLLEPRYAKVRAAVGGLASRLENNLAGILVIKSFTAEDYEAERLAEASDEYRAANHEAIALSAAFTPLIRMAIAVGFSGVIAVGGLWCIEGSISAGALVLFCMMIQRILWPLTRLGEVFDEYQRANASAARIFSLLDTPSRITDPAAPKALARASGRVAFADVRFRYRRGEVVLDGLAFDIQPGETVGLAGPTGAGKSTIIKLLLRLYDTDEGAVRIDDCDVRDLTQSDLRRQIALVSQDVYLFHGTIAENIAYGTPEAEHDLPRIEQAARLAELHDFVATLSDGYDTVVGERGIQLSGGQRQRLSIARAILKDAPILVFDEATSSVDTETERAIHDNLEALTRGRTALVIAHRLSTIRNADRILVLKGGRVVEEGTHDDLVAAAGTYADLWNVQSGRVGDPHGFAAA